VARDSNPSSLKNINRLAFPAILAGIAEPVISLVDTAFIGQLGTEQLAAAGIASSFYLMLVWILSQSVTAVAAIVSRHSGQGKLTDIKTLIPQGFFANILLGFSIFGVTYVFAIPIFDFYNAENKILDYCVDYYHIRSVGFPFTLATMFLFGTFRGLQNTVWAMQIAMVGAAINLGLDYALIFGIKGLVPAMGIKGAAWASLASQIAMLILACIRLLRNTPFDFELKRKLNPAFKWLTGMSSDLLVRTILLNLTFYLAIRQATSYGPAYIAAHTIAINIWLFSSFFIDGYAHAGNAISGMLLGADQREEIYHLGKKVGKISLLIGAGLMTIYLGFYPFIAKIFTTDTEVILLFNSVFWLVALSQPINALAFCFDGIYKGLGETKLLRNILMGATLLGFIPVDFLLHNFYPGLMGIWIAFLVWMVIRAGWLIYDFQKFRPIENQD
jgi:putative MATE family efflux protein